MMNDRDRTFATIVDKSTIVCDFRKAKSSISDVGIMVRGIANRHFWGSTSGMVKETGGTLLGNGFINTYHVASVKRGLWVASLSELSPDDTRPIAQAVLS